MSKPLIELDGVEELLDGEAEALTRKAIDKALEGDMAALRMCLDRLLPPRRNRYEASDLFSLLCAEVE